MTWSAPGIQVSRPAYPQVEQIPTRRLRHGKEGDAIVRARSPSFSPKDRLDTPFSRYVEAFLAYHQDCVGSGLGKKSRCTHPTFPSEGEWLSSRFPGDTATTGYAHTSRDAELRAPQRASQPAQAGAMLSGGVLTQTPPGSPTPPIRP